MVTCGPEPDLFAFYTSRYAEDDRLRMSPHGRLEFARTRELLERYLPPAPAWVLDVGGGTGVHARWLTESGYRTHVVGLVPAHVAQAASIAGVTAGVGDARHLDQPDTSVDVVLLLGPLYHLLEHAGAPQVRVLLADYEPRELRRLAPGEGEQRTLPVEAGNGSRRRACRARSDGGCARGLHRRVLASLPTR